MSNINTPCLYLKLDTVVSDKVFDSAGNLLVGTATNTSLVTDPTFGSCLGFNGTSSKVVTTNLYQGRAFPPTAGVYSTTVWVYPKAYQPNPSPSEWTNIFFNLALGEIILVQMSLSANGELQLFFNSSERVTFQDVILPLNTWCFLGVSVNGNTLELAVNGLKLPSYTLESPAVSSNANNSLCLANNAGGLYFNGNLAHARVYAEALSDTELLEVMNADLAGGMLLHLPMATDSGTGTSNASTPNYSPYQDYTAHPVNSPVLEGSDQFGTTMHFNGTNQYLALNGLTCSNTKPWTAITIECWVKVTQVQNGAILSFDPNNFFELGITASGGTAKVAWTTVDTNNVKNVQNGNKDLADGQWHFITAVYRAGDGLKAIYMDGEADVSVQGAHAGLCLGTSVSNTTRYGAVALSGRAFFYNSFDPTYSHFAGNLCQLKLFSSALSEEDIQRDMGASFIAEYSFWKGYPLLFSIQEEYVDNTIYIYETPEGHSIDLVFLNTTTSSPLSFSAQTTAGPDNYQLAVTFRPGVLSEATVQQMGLANAGWRMSSPTILEDGSVTLYFTASSPFTLQPMQELRLTLTAVSADPLGGARGTKVQLVYRNIYYLDSQSPISGDATANVNIVNHDGSSDTPFLLGFVDTDTLYNGPSNRNMLQLRLTNIMDPAGGGGAITFKGGQTTLVLVLQGASSLVGNDPGPFNIWTSIGGYTVNMDNGLKGEVTWTIAKVDNGSAEYYWTLKPNADFTLMPGAQLQINISDMVVQSTDGFSNLYLSYENLPNFWDGKLVVQVMKSKVIQSASGNLGIGTDTPLAPLQITGASNASISTPNSGYILLGDPNSNQLALGYDTIAAKSTSTSSGALNIQSSYLTLSSAAEVTGTLKVGNGNLMLDKPSGDKVLSFTVSDAFQSGFVADSASNLYIRTGGSLSSYNRIAINAAGNIGVNGSAVSTTQLMVTSSQTVSLTTTTATGVLVLGSPSGNQLAFDANNLTAKASPTQLGTLNINGGSINLNASAPIVIQNGADLQWSGVSKLKVDSLGITAATGGTVKGIPVVEWRSVKISIASASKQGGVSATGTVTFSSPPVQSPLTAITAWKMTYGGSSDHHVRVLSVVTEVDPSGGYSSSSATVTIKVTLQMDDTDGNKSAGYATVLVMGLLNKAVNY